MNSGAVVVSAKGAAVVVSKDQDFCGETLPNESYLIDAVGGLKNVVVSIETVPVALVANSQKLNVIENTGLPLCA